MKLYSTHYALQGIQPAFPASMRSLASWIAHLATSRVKSKTIKAYLTGVRSAHIDMCYDDDLSVFHHPRLERMIAGHRRLHGEAETKERQPLTKDLLLQILPQFDRATRYGAMMRAAFCLAFATFLRIGEFTYSIKDREQEDFGDWFLTRRSVRLYDEYIELILPASKTDPFRRGITLTAAASGDDACVVAALRYLFRKWPETSSSPLFEYHGCFHRDLVTANLRQALRSLGIQGHYSGHSFRRGAATSAREAGLSNEEIQLLGRWKSDSYRLYITSHPARILAISRRHQIMPEH